MTGFLRVLHCRLHWSDIHYIYNNIIIALRLQPHTCARISLEWNRFHRRHVPREYASTPKTSMCHAYLVATRRERLRANTGTDLTGNNDARVHPSHKMSADAILKYDKFSPRIGSDTTISIVQLEKAAKREKLLTRA